MTQLAVHNGLVPPQTPTLGQSPAVFARALIAGLSDPAAFSMDFCLRAIEANLRLSRDLLPADHASLAQAMRRTLATAQERSIMDTVQALDRLSLQLAALTGLQVDRMTRDQGWRVLMMGRLIERLVKMSETLQFFLERDAADSSRGFDALLTLFDSIITYRARYQGYQEIDALTELLVFDESNPRALCWIVQELLVELSRLPNPGEELMAVERRLRSLQPRRVQGIDPVQTSALLASLGCELSDSLSSQYFAHVHTRRTRA